jgi:hypothetical protein
MQKSTYIRISKLLIRRLFFKGCWGAGSLYEDNLKNGIKEDGKDTKQVLDALCKQRIICSKPHIYGTKYFLNPDRRDKIGEIIKEKPRKRNSILLLLLMDYF